MRYFVEIAGRSFEIDLSGPVPRIDGEELPDLGFEEIPGTGRFQLRLGTHRSELTLRPAAGRGPWIVEYRGRSTPVEVVDERTRSIRELGGGMEAAAPRVVTAPMPGRVVRLTVAVGESVAAGQGVAVVEAMKMENELRAPSDGTVASIEVSPGATIEKGAILIVLE